jgi:hypothetical protein
MVNVPLLGFGNNITSSIPVVTELTAVVPAVSAVRVHTFTAIALLVTQPRVVVKKIDAVPPDTPVNTPELLIVAIELVLVLHTPPPEVVLNKVTVEPTQSLVAPVIAESG